MNLKFQKAQLVNALSIVMKAISTKTSSVILESILITAADNRVVIGIDFRINTYNGS